MSGLSHRVSLRFSDGIEQSITVASGQLVLDAALEAGLPMLYQCRAGSCTSCAARLIGGEAQMRPDAGSSLLPSEHAAGVRLLCLTEPQSDCAFELRYDSATGAARAGRAHVFVNAVERVANDVVRLTLELAEGEWFDFRPGQFIQVKVPGSEAVRSYSVATTPTDLPRLELLIRLLPDGAMSDYLRGQARVDDVLEIEGPFGAFFIRDRVRAPHVMIAGGTGLAPILSMIDTVRRRAGHKPSILLSFGCASRDGLFYLDELELRRLWLPTLEARVSIDQDAAFGGVRRGNPVEAVEAGDINDPETVAYLCGPPAMVESARSRLARLGLRPENIFAERFVPSG